MMSRSSLTRIATQLSVVDVKAAEVACITPIVIARTADLDGRTSTLRCAWPGYSCTPHIASLQRRIGAHSSFYPTIYWAFALQYAHTHKKCRTNVFLLPFRASIAR